MYRNRCVRPRPRPGRSNWNPAMNPNPFFDSPSELSGDHNRWFGRAYLRLDEVELDAGIHLRASAVRAEDIDPLLKRGKIDANRWQAFWQVDARIAIVDFACDTSAALLDLLLAACQGPPHEQGWFAARISIGNASNATRYRVLLDPEGEHVLVDEIKSLSPARMLALSKMTEPPKSADATSTQIAGILAPVSKAVAAMTLDVGQGAATALLDSAGGAVGYFDFGGGVTSHAPTFPSGLTHVDLGSTPPIVLSHWDWDHWSSDRRFPAASTCSWIVPRQRYKLGSVHASFAASLHARGRLSVWPSLLRSVTVGGLRIERCVPAGRADRNNTGLAAIWLYPSGNTRFLLAGDADYASVPSCSASVEGLLVSHHGGTVPSSPPRAATAAARAVISCAGANLFGHPTPRTSAALIARFGNVIQTAGPTRPMHVALDAASLPASRLACRLGLTAGSCR